MGHAKLKYMNLGNILIHKNKSIVEALQKLNTIRDVSRLILFVEDDDKVVIGSLTDGDIRRSLASEMDINKKVEGVCYKNFTFEHEGKDFLKLHVHRKNGIKILPILDQQKRLTRILIWIRLIRYYH